MRGRIGVARLKPGGGGGPESLANGIDRQPEHAPLARCLGEWLPRSIGRHAHDGAQMHRANEERAVPCLHDSLGGEGTVVELEGGFGCLRTRAEGEQKKQRNGNTHQVTTGPAPESPREQTRKGIPERRRFSVW